ncbi:MAG TPA: hypothetical protein VGQ66_04170 [Candidatus Limnocylindria bacterium]|jgi:hypothetical protein|nr:hypothetical protein [Candidatus Limnocylindria bacterium]
MTILTWLRRVPGLPLYPILAAGYPVIYLYAQNVQEAIAAAEVFVPLAISIGATLIVMAIFGALTRAWAAAALASTLLLVLFFTYGMAWDWLGSMLLGHWVLLAAWLLLAIIGLSFIWRFHGVTDRVSLPLNVITGLALLFNLVTISAFVFNVRPTSASNGSGVTASGEAPTPARLPDVYWIILEEYGSQRVLLDDFHYDNTPFLDALRERGFYIANDSTANYLKTAPAIEAARNMEYLDGPALRAQAKADDDWGPIYRGLRSPFEVQKFLDGLGYEFIYAGTFWSPMGKHPSADINYVYDKLTSEFLGVLQRATILRVFEDLGPEAPYDWRRNRYNQTLYELRSLRRASSLPGPKFIHTQLALNHEPYVFHPDGSFLTADEERSLPHEEQYIEQLKYTNIQMLAWMDQLLDVPEDERPIIVLAADEGPWPPGYRHDERGFDWTTASPAVLKQKFGILNAVYLPDQDPEEAGFYSGISLVNEFRVVFNAEFGLDLPLLPDRNYIWPDQSKIYQYIDVTDEVR